MANLASGLQWAETAVPNLTKKICRVVFDMFPYPPSSSPAQIVVLSCRYPSDWQPRPLGPGASLAPQGLREPLDT